MAEQETPKKSKQMLSHLINEAGKLPIRLSIISFFLLFAVANSYSQSKATDTAAFKKEFEKLLLKYGITGKGYAINVTSINQAGGQTAFMISNNYYHDSVLDATNFEFSIKDDILTVYPKRGIWTSAFASTDSLKANRRFIDPGVGVSASIHGTSIIIDGKIIPCAGIIRSSPCSKRFPMEIKMLKDDPDQFYIFGDMQEDNKIYLYHNGKVIWFPMKENKN